MERIAALSWTLALTDFKLRFYGSALGYVWSLVRPFAFFGVVYFVFTEIANVGAGIEHYGVYVLFSMVLFQFFAEITNGCLNSLVQRESLLRKMRFPRIVIPLSVAITALLNLGMTLIAVMIFAVISGVYPSATWLELPLIVALLTVFSLGVGMLLSILYVYYRDVQPIWEVATQVLFYASPVLYVATMVPESFQQAYLANPLATLFTEMRHAVIDPAARPVWEAIGSGERLLVPAAVIVAAFALGWWLFDKRSPRIAEHL
jgi:ABC-2 type transport system permease protein